MIERSSSKITGEIVLDYVRSQTTFFYTSSNLLVLDYVARISEQVWQLRDNRVAAKPLSSDGDTLKES